MTTYSISLDDVDLALLPLRTSYNNFLRKEHYQFEVKKTVTFEVPEPSTRYTCHICAIVMPAAFAREHTASVKHRANTRIASVAAQRLCALISALPPPSAAPTGRFCANCATVADDDHYKTKEHRDAVAHDNLLWDLMKAYAQESPDDDPKYDLDCSNNQRSSNNGMDKNNDHKKDDLEFKNDGDNTNNNAMAAQAIAKNQPTESIDREKQHKPIEEEHITKNCEINNNLGEHNGDHKTDDVNDNISTCNMVTVVKVKSAILVEYPYEVTASGHTYCVVCKCKVPGGAHNREEHVKGSRHRKMVLAQNQPTGLIELQEQIVKNSDLKGTLEAYTEGEEFTDVITDNISTHIKKSKDAVTIKISDLKVDTQIVYPYDLTATGMGHVRCIVCDCKMPSGERTKEEHIRGQKHRRMVISQSQPTQPIKEAEEEQTEKNNGIDDNLDEYSEDEEFSDDNNSMGSNLYEANDEDVIEESQIECPFKVTATDVDCVVCDSEVPNYEQSRNDHVEGQRHRNMMNRANDEEEKHIAEEYETNDSFEEYSEDEEFDNNDNKNMSSNIQYPFKVTAIGVDCVVCECHVPNHEHNRIEHIRGGEHRHMVERPFKVIGTGLHCMVCDCEVPNHEQSRNEHIHGCRHRNMTNRANGSRDEEEEQIAEECETNDSFEEYSEDAEFDNNDNKNMSSNIQYPFKVTAIGVDCVVCECHVPNHEHNRIEHIRGGEHRHMVERPFKVIGTGLHCMVCDCEVPNHEQSRNEHIQGCRHRNMTNRANGSIDEEEEQIAEACETSDSFEEYSEDEEFDNDDNDSMRSNIQYPFKVTAIGVDCMVCDCHVPNHEHTRNEHIRGWRHRYMIERLFQETATGLHCMVCDCRVPNHEQSRNEHIQGCRHRNMMNRAKNESTDEEGEQIAEACETNDSFEEYSEDEEFDNDDHESSSSITAHSQIEYPFEVTANGHVECVICDCNVLGNVHNREEHINGMRHRNMMRNQPEEEEQSPENS